MGTKFVSNPQLNLITGEQEKTLAIWFDDGLKVKDRMMQPEMFGGLMDLLESRNVYPQHYDKYAEPGYTNPENGIIVGNWNNADGKHGGYGEKMGEWLENTMNIDCVFDDEWHYCSHCYGLIRTSPSSYGWIKHYVEMDCELICLDCLEENWEDWGEDVLEDYLEYADGTPPVNLKAFPVALLDKLTDSGFVCLDDEESEACQRFESGWHQGQTDDPKEILKELHKTFPDSQVIFVLNSVGQFDCAFSCWIRYEVEEY